MEENIVVAIEGFCEEGLFFSMGGWNGAIAVGMLIALGVSLFWSHKHLMKATDRKYSYWLMPILTLLSIGSVLAADLFTFVVCFVILMLVGYLLVIQGGSVERLKAGSTYLTYVLVTSMIFFMGMFLLKHEMETLEFAQMAEQTAGIISMPELYLPGILMLIGLGMCMGIFPVHPWRISLYENASLPTIGFFASVMNKTGLVGLWFITQAVFRSDEGWHKLIVAIGLLTLLVAGLRSLFATTHRKSINFISMAGMGGLCLLMGLNEYKALTVLVLLHMLGSLLLVSSLDIGKKPKKVKEGVTTKGIKYAAIRASIGGILLCLIPVSSIVLVRGLSLPIMFMTIVLCVVMVFGVLRLVYSLAGIPRLTRLRQQQWPSWLSLEQFVYTPVIMHFIPFVLTVICRICDKSVDAVVYFLRHTILKNRKERIWDKVGTPSTYVCGIILDEFVLFLNKTFFRKKPIQVSYVNLLAEYKVNLTMTSKLVTRSVSFGLLLFCIGLCVTLGYLLFF